MRERMACLLAAATLAGCTHAQVHGWATGRWPTCELRLVQDQVGREATPGRLKRMTRISRASEVRVIRPGLWHGAEVKPTRLSVTVDGGNRITGLSCG